MMIQSLSVSQTETGHYTAYAEVLCNGDVLTHQAVAVNPEMASKKAVAAACDEAKRKLLATVRVDLRPVF